MTCSSPLSPPRRTAALSHHAVSPAPLDAGRRRAGGGLLVAALLAVVLFLTALSGARADAATTPVTATPSQVAAQLFVAGDIGRLSDVPSGTEDVVLEKVLQQLYADNPALSPSDAVADVRGLQTALSSGGAETSPATLTVMSGNERVLAILEALESSNPAAPVALAVTQVAKVALTDASNVKASSGQFFDASADTLSTLSFGSFSPAVVLEATVTLGASNPGFASARNQLWSAMSHESLGDTTTELLSENPALANDPDIQALVSTLSGGSFSSDVNTILSTIQGEETVVSDQTCTPSGGASVPGSGQPSCTSGALHDAEQIAAQCPNGISGCSLAATYANDPQNEATTIANETTAETAEAGLLGYANAQLQTAEQAAAETSAQISDEENDYLNAQALNMGLKTGEDVVSLVTTLSVSEIDPVAAIGALFNVVNDAVGYGVNAPDPNMIIIQGLQNISQQISDFEQYTQSAFASINAQLGSLSSQIAQETYQLNAQLTNAQNQITTLGSSLTKLQSSVDQLQAEIQSLFVAGANNDLGQVTSQWLGYPALNGIQIPASMFGTPAGELYQDATGTAVSQTVLSAPGLFDAPDADTQLTASSSDPLDTNINYFDFFPEAVSDSPTGRFLTTSLAPGCAAQASGELCLPNPDFWASSTRAFAQLLLENPSDVTQARLNQLQAMISDGTVLQQALSKVSANDAGTDSSGTGSKLFDGLLSYDQYWATGDHTSGPPSLQQALENEEQAYLASQPVPDQNLNDQGVNPWGGINQLPDITNLVNSTTFTNVPLCEQTDLPPGYTAQTAVLPHLSSLLLFEALPYDLLNAVRLGASNISVCWIARFDNGSPGGQNYGPLTMSLVFMGTIPDPNNPNLTERNEIGLLTANVDTFDDDLAGGDGTNDAEYTVLAGWQATNGATDFSTLLQPQMTSMEQEVLQIAQGIVGAYNDPTTSNELNALQQGIYNAILSNGSTLTQGTSESTDVAAAAQRLDGADTLLSDYVRLGLPQALASDDNLQNLINGAESDVFAYPGVNTFGDTTLPGVPAQLVQYIEAARGLPAGFDPASSVKHSFVTAVTDRANALTSAIGSYVRSGRASGQDDSAAGGGALAEASPLVSSTLDRLNLSEDVLADTLNGTIDTTGTTTTSSSSSSTQTATTTTSSPVSTTTTASSPTTTSTSSITTSTKSPATSPTTTTSSTSAAATSPTTTTNTISSTTGTSSTTHSSTTTTTSSASGAQSGVQAVTVFVLVPVVIDGSEVTFTVRCATATCHDQALETIVEHLVGRNIASISSNGKAKKTSKTVLVGSTSFTLAPGARKKFTLALNATGRSLLKQRGSLPVTLQVTQQQGGGRTRTIRTSQLVVRAGKTAKKG